MLKSTGTGVEARIHSSVNKIIVMIVLASSFLFFAARVDAEASNPSSYSLVGTIQSKTFIGAVINDAKGEQSFFRIYEKLPDGTQIVEVRSDSISVKEEAGTRYDIYINHNMKTAGAASQSAHKASYAPATSTPDVKPTKAIPRSGKRRRLSSPEKD